MNGIDIASYQTGIDLTKVPCDFVIVKATQGTGYTNPDFKRAIEQGLAAGKCMGLYHYASGGDPTSEAMFFLKTIKPYIGKVILCLDWESSQNPAFGVRDLSWVREWISVVTEETSATPFLYVSSSRISRFASIADKFKLWAAQYPDYDPVNGYLDTPWNEGAYDCAIRQYTSSGYLPGWGKRLDLNKAYITAAEWEAYQGGAISEKPAESIFLKSVEEVAEEVLAGKWGNGEERKENLIKAGYDYNKIQNEVNLIVYAREVIAGKWGNGLDRMSRLTKAGLDYKEIQKKVNQIYNV